LRVKRDLFPSAIGEGARVDLVPVAGVEYLNLHVVVAAYTSTGEEADAVACDSIAVDENKPVRPISIRCESVSISAIGVGVGRVVIIRAGLIPPRG